MAQTIYPFWEQSKTKTKTMIEDVLPHYLDSDNHKIALGFIEYLRENKMKPTWAVQNGWTGMCKSKVLYWIRLPQVKSNLDADNPTHHHFRTIKPSDKTNWTKSWVITPYFSKFDSYKDIIVNEELHNFFLDNLHFCRPGCSSDVNKPGENKNCHPGVSKVLFDREVKRICRGDLYGTMTAWFVNPNETEIIQIKRLLELERQARGKKHSKIKAANIDCEAKTWRKKWYQ